MKQDFDDFNLYYNSLLSSKQAMKMKSVEINDKIETIRAKVFEKIEIWEKSAENEINIEYIAMYLINMSERLIICHRLQ